ncbi:MAG: DUF4199 domain-containing protein [Bacteroides sp.]|nr:DUF4199 domain-containing protein [Bacteroides sp.]
MNEKRVSIQRFAMHFGTYMGILWIVKFAFFPLGFSNPLLMFLFVGLTVAVPFVAFRFAKIFRDKFCGGTIGFLQSWVFLIFMFMFASLLTAVAHYIYFRYLDNGFIIETYASMVNNFPKEIQGMEVYINQLQEAMEQVKSLTPIQITIQLLSNNVVNCSILSLIIALFVMKKPQLKV